MLWSQLKGRFKVTGTEMLEHAKSGSRGVPHSVLKWVPAQTKIFRQRLYFKKCPGLKHLLCLVSETESNILVFTL